MFELVFMLTIGLIKVAQESKGFLLVLIVDKR